MSIFFISLKKKIARVIIFSLPGVCFLPASSGAQEVIVTRLVDNRNEAYSLDLLNLALSYSSQTYRIEQFEERKTQAREIDAIKNGKMDVVWLGTSKTLENELLPIRIPLFKGMLGHRVLMIRGGEQSKFNNIRTLQDMQRVTLGQGKTWTDTEILQAAGMTLLTTMKYPNLFYMLEGGRFDAFPRGVHEPWEELTRHTELNLVVEKRLMLVYRYPLFFFVSRQNTKLARDIERGLIAAYDEGRFDEFFLSSPFIQDVITKANMKQRLVFNIPNPTLSEASRSISDRYWLDIERL